MIPFVTDSIILQTALWISISLFGAALIASFVRLVIGPSLPDRVVALDLASLLIVSLLALFAMATAVSSYLDVAIALALVAFLGTVAFARFVELGSKEGLTYHLTKDPTL